MSIIASEHKIHSANCALAEGVRQGAVSAAILAGGGSVTVAAAIKTAEIVFYRTIVSSAAANGLPSAQFGQALRDLGTGGI